MPCRAKNTPTQPSQSKLGNGDTYAKPIYQIYCVTGRRTEYCNVVQTKKKKKKK